jgi:hypothetical protein
VSNPVHLYYDEGTDAARLWSRRGPSSEWALHAQSTVDPETLPRIAILLIGDGRDELRAATIESFLAEVYGYRLGYVVQVDDHRHEMGFGGAIQTGWHYLSTALREAALEGVPAPFDYVFHLEEDWSFAEPIDVRWLAAILDGGGPVLPALAQAALRRGPVNAAERAAGGVVQAWPSEYVDCGILSVEGGAVPYLAHRLYFTTNPSLYRSSLMMLGWPDGPRSEQTFTEACKLFGYSFALYGKRDHPPSILHTGHTRTGIGY